MTPTPAPDAPLPDAEPLTAAEVAALCGVCERTASVWMTRGRWDGRVLASRKTGRLRSPRTTTAGALRRFLKEVGRPVPAALRWRVAGPVPPGPDPKAAGPAPRTLAPGTDPAA